MSTFKEEIEKEIAVFEAEIAALKQHLESGESWLETEGSLIWQRFRHMFTPPAASPITPAPIPAGTIPPAA